MDRWLGPDCHHQLATSLLLLCLDAATPTRKKGQISFYEPLLVLCLSPLYFRVQTFNTGCRLADIHPVECMWSNHRTINSLPIYFKLLSTSPMLQNHTVRLGVFGHTHRWLGYGLFQIPMRDSCNVVSRGCSYIILGGMAA